jgi:pilus assembly protein CpaE
MKVALISGTDAQLASLRSLLETEGHDVTNALQRHADSPLSALIEALDTEVLIVECTEAQQAQDIAAIDVFVSTHPQVVVLMLSTQRDANALLTAMQAGVREVLSSPVIATELTAALRRIALRKKLPPLKATRAKTISFLSCKGGSGATFLATNFADILAKDLGKKTAFLDLDLQCGDAAYYVSPGPNRSDITELARQIDRLDAKLLSASVLHIHTNFDMLSAPEDPESGYTMNASQLDRLLDVIEVNYDMVVLDLERLLSPVTIQALDRSDVVYLVMENLLPFVRSAKRLVTKLRSLGYDDSKIRVVVNRYEKNDTIDVAQIEKALGIKVTHTIRSSFQDVAQAINTGVPLTAVNPHNSIVQVLRDMAHGYDTTHAPRTMSWINRFMRGNS